MKTKQGMSDSSLFILLINVSLIWSQILNYIAEIHFIPEQGWSLFCRFLGSHSWSRRVSMMRQQEMVRVKRIWFLLPMQAAKVQTSLRVCAVSPEPPLLAHTSSESRGTFRQKARSLAPLNGWTCAVTICYDGMLEDTNSLDGAQIIFGTCTTRHSDLVLKKSNQWSWRRCDNKKCLQTERWTDRRTSECSQTVRKAPLDYVPQVAYGTPWSLSPQAY